MESTIKLIEKYNATGRVAFYHSRTDTVSLNGGKRIPSKQAREQMASLVNPKEHTK